MKLIDRDALMIVYTPYEFMSDMGDAMEILANFPTVEAVPVRHGKWLSREEGCLYPFWERYTCSECGKHADDTKYCPNCGAKMDGEREEECGHQ